MGQSRIVSTEQIHQAESGTHHPNGPRSSVIVAWKGLPLASMLPSGAGMESQKSSQRRYLSISYPTPQIPSPGPAHFKHNINKLSSAVPPCLESARLQHIVPLKVIPGASHTLLRSCRASSTLISFRFVSFRGEPRATSAFKRGV